MATSSPPPGNVTAALASFFAHDEGDTPQFSESQIRQISDLLGQVNRAWRRVPRTYTVLRISGQLHYLDVFINRGFRDDWFPVSTESPFLECLSSTAKADFMKAQSAILTECFNLRRGGTGKHTTHSYEPLSLESRAIIGSGRLGHVDRVVSLAGCGEYARKRIRREGNFEQAQMTLNSYSNELEVLKRVQHRHIVELVGIYTDPTYLGLIMSPVADCNLSEFLALVSTSSDKISLLRSFFGCLAIAVAYLHNSEIRHKDIKPSNILIKRGNVLVADFGLLRDPIDATCNTTEEITTFSPRYCAPEVAENEPHTSSADIWSLGCVFLEMATLLKGETVDAMEAIFNTGSSRGQHFYSNPDGTWQWILMLRATGLQSDNEPLNWTSRMLQFDRYARPSAAALFETITRSSSGTDPNAKFCGTCCAGDSSDSEGAIAKGVQGLNIKNARRVFCDKCDEYPAGFRGIHELRRHNDRAHGIRRMWVVTECHDPSSPVPGRPLADCEFCRLGRRYHAEYSAAAHLRRAHFNPKWGKRRTVGSDYPSTKGKEREKGSGDYPSLKEKERERRGSGYYLPMEILRKWMEEVVEDLRGI